MKSINLNDLDDWNWQKNQFDNVVGNEDEDEEEDDYYWLCQEELAL